jgi:hypothetical protein
MLMPEVAMHKDHFAASGKHDVGLAWQVSPVKPKSIACSVKQGTQHNLGLSVLAPDAAHILAAALRIEFIHV